MRRRSTFSGYRVVPFGIFTAGSAGNTLMLARTRPRSSTISSARPRSTGATPSAAAPGRAREMASAVTLTTVRAMRKRFVFMTLLSARIRRIRDACARLRRGSQEPPLEQNGRGRRHAKDKKKDGELFGHRITSPRDADPHIGAGEDEPQRDISDSRHERGAGILGGKELSQQQRGTEEQEPCNEEERGAHGWRLVLPKSRRASIVRIQPLSSTVVLKDCHGVFELMLRN